MRPRRDSASSRDSSGSPGRGASGGTHIRREEDTLQSAVGWAMASTMCQAKIHRAGHARAHRTTARSSAPPGERTRTSTMRCTARTASRPSATFSGVLALATVAAALALTAAPIMADVSTAPGIIGLDPESDHAHRHRLPRRQIFRRFVDDTGKIESATATKFLDGRSKFFDPDLGTNGQACVTCHEPAQGFTLHVDDIEEAFSESAGSDPMFRLNDTADRPDANASDPDAFKLFRTMGIMRIGKTLPAGADY